MCFEAKHLNFINRQFMGFVFKPDVLYLQSSTAQTGFYNHIFLTDYLCHYIF